MYQRQYKSSFDRTLTGSKEAWRLVKNYAFISDLGLSYKRQRLLFIELVPKQLSGYRGELTTKTVEEEKEMRAALEHLNLITILKNDQ